MSKPAIATQALTRRFGDKVAVDHLDLHVPLRSVYGFLEPNGAGKSTTIRLLLGLLRLTEGTVHLLGQPFQPNQRVLLWRIGTLVEMPSLYGHLTGRENGLLRLLPGGRSCDRLSLPIWAPGSFSCCITG